MSNSAPTNQQIAEVLEQIADLLENQDANPFRVRAYLEGAESVGAPGLYITSLVRSGKRE